MSLVPTSCPGSLISSEDEGTWEGVDLVPMILGFRRSVKSFLTWRRKRWGTSSHNIEIRRYFVEKHVCVWFTGKGNSCSSSDQSARHPSAICVHIWVDFVVGTRLVPGVFIWVLWYSKFQYVRPGYVASSLNILIYFNLVKLEIVSLAFNCQNYSRNGKRLDLAICKTRVNYEFPSHGAFFASEGEN